MPLLIAYLTKYWWLVPLLALFAWVGIERLELQHARATITELQNHLESIDAAGKQQALETAKILADERDKSAKVIADFESFRAAHGAFADDVATRLRGYEARIAACAVSHRPDPAASSGGQVGSDASSSPDQRIGDTLARLIPACQAVIDHDAAAIDYIQTVRH